MPAAKKKAPTATNIRVVLGSDEGRVKEAAAKLAIELTPEGGDEFSTEVIDGIAENADHAGKICADAIQAIQTLPFFGGDKLVWLKNLNFAADNVTGRARAAIEGLDSLAEILKAGIPSDVRLLISATEVDKRRTFYKTLASIAQIDAFDRPSADRWEAEVATFVSRAAKERGLDFDRQALEHFVHVAGENSSLVLSELEKLDVYLGEDREVSVEDIQAIVSLGRGGIVFEIGNAIGKGDLGGAIDLVDHFLFRGENAVGILLAAIVPKVRNLLYARDIEERLGIRAGNFQSYSGALAKLPESEVGHLPKKKDGKPSVYPIFLAAGEARKFPLRHLKVSLAACLEANERLVTSSLDQQLVLHQLLAKVLAPVAARRRM